MKKYKNIITLFILSLIGLSQFANANAIVLQLTNQTNSPVVLIPQYTGCAKWSFEPSITLSSNGHSTYVGDTTYCPPSYEFKVNLIVTSAAKNSPKTYNNSIQLKCSANMIGCSIASHNFPANINNKTMRVKTSGEVEPINIILYPAK